MSRNEPTVVAQFEAAEQQDLIDRRPQSAEAPGGEIVRRVECLLDEAQHGAAMPIAALGELKRLAQHPPLRALGSDW